jgi:predicted metal-dependent peptidase
MKILSEDIFETYQDCKKLQQKILKLDLDGFQALTHPDLIELSKKFAKIIHFAETHLISAHDVFYGLLLLNFEPKISFTIRGPIDTSRENSNFFIFYNPMFIMEYSYQEFITLLVAEMLGFVYGHPYAYAYLNAAKQKSLHLALEHAGQASLHALISTDIKLTNNPMKKLKLPAYLMDLDKFKKTYKSKTILPKQSIEYYFEAAKVYLNGQDPLSDESIPDQPLFATPRNQQGQVIHQWYVDEDYQRDGLNHDIQHMVSDTYKTLDQQQLHRLAESTSVQIKKLLRPPAIPWTQMLKKYLGTIPGSSRHSKMRLNRRQPYRADLSGTLSNRLVEIVIAIDTSGSMSYDYIKRAMNEIYNIVKHYKTKLTVIEADHQIQNVYYPKDLREVNPEVKGRGGTWFKPVIDYINKENTFKKALMIYFTDGFGDTTIPKPMTYRNLWVVLDNVDNLSLKQPYGEVVALKIKP